MSTLKRSIKSGMKRRECLRRGVRGRHPSRNDPLRAAGHRTELVHWTRAGLGRQCQAVAGPERWAGWLCREHRLVMSEAALPDEARRDHLHDVHRRVHRRSRELAEAPLNGFHLAGVLRPLSKERGNGDTEAAPGCTQERQEGPGGCTSEEDHHEAIEHDAQRTRRRGSQGRRPQARGSSGTGTGAGAMTVQELQREAARLNIEGRSKMGKAQLIRAVGQKRRSRSS
jgi:hypothetical protein